MQITTNRGKTFDVIFADKLLRNGSKIMIELADDRPFKDIAADFDGLETITRLDAKDIDHVFRGYSRLVGMQINEDAGTVRLTLKKGDAA